MSRLSAYLVRLFTRESLALLALMLGLLFLVQCLKIFDVVVVKGQNLPTLIGQAALGMPPLAVVIAYVCAGIGVVRGFGALQASHELHLIHSSRRLGAVFAGATLFAVGGAVAVLVLTNFVEPWANRRLTDWSESIAADIVGRTLTPHKFSEVVPGVTIVIGGREGIGNITDFFADDQRDPTSRRTYSARTAKIAARDEGYLLQMHDGTLQYLIAPKADATAPDGGEASASSDEAFSEVGFKTYAIGLDQLTRPVDNGDINARRTTPEIINAVRAGETLSPETLKLLLKRQAEGLRLLSMCVFIAALTAFPHARRRRGWFPLELVPLLAAYAGNSTENFALPPALSQFTGPVVMLAAGLVIFAFRLGVLRRRPRRVVPA